MNVDHVCAELERLLSEGAALEAILETAVNKMHAAHPHFDWTGIYELVNSDRLELGPFVGAPSVHNTIRVGQGVCGTAVKEKRDINVPDVRAVDNYLACSVETRSELVVLIREGDTIYAQIDIDSHTPNAFDAEMTAAVERVAAVLAKAFARQRTDRG